MRVFISWSGETSKALAEVIRQWLPGVIQAIKPYCSTDDIIKGVRWNTEIAKELEAASVGIICLNKENLDAPWIMFEAGALSKNLDKSHVVPILFGVSPSDVKGPLVQFQAAKFEKDDMKQVVKMINLQLGDSAVSEAVLDKTFEIWWHILEKDINQVLEKSMQSKSIQKRSDHDILEESLELIRTIARNSPHLLIESDVIRNLSEAYFDLVKATVPIDGSAKVYNNFDTLGGVISKLVDMYAPDMHMRIMMSNEELDKIRPSVNQ